LITDSQMHLWAANGPEEPWPTDRETVPHRDIPLDPGNVLPLLDEAGVDRVVIVPPIWSGDRNIAPLRFAREHPTRLGVMGRFDLWAPDAQSVLERWLDQPGMLGVRMSYPKPLGQSWIEPGTFDWFWATCERLQIPLMIWLAGEGRKIEWIAQRHPNLTLILDHMSIGWEAP
jgi:predicted TIM-barrel fold metal-dependent hydrolase